jgi:hypothetical protein
MKEGGNAVGATRKQPLGRASARSIVCRSIEVKAPRLLRGLATFRASIRRDGIPLDYRS